MIDIRHGQLFRHDLIHPDEISAKLSLQNNAIMDSLAATIAGIKMKLTKAADMLLTAYPVTDKTLPRVYTIYKKVLSRLDCDQEYKLYVNFEYKLTAESYGSAKDGYIIVINSACIDELDDNELAALIGHEVGHVLSEHVQYNETLDSVDELLKIPFSDLVKKGIYSFFASWMIASEYTADRAALIASGSLEAVLSLLKKQSGLKGATPTIKQLLSQEIAQLSSKPGLFYILAAQSMPTFGMVARMKEIARWCSSDEFGEKQPFLYYSAKDYLGIPAKNDEENELYLLHRRAYHGNAIAATILGKRYILKDTVLKQMPVTGISLLLMGAYNGDAESMYLVSKCMNAGLSGLNQNNDIEAQLIKAASSRDQRFEKLIINAENEFAIDILPEICKTFINSKGDSTRCCSSIEVSDKPIESENATLVKNAFWMPQYEKVYLLEIENICGEWYGVALTPHGIYGRVRNEVYPYYKNWKEVAKSEVSKCIIKNEEWICCDGKRIIPTNSTLKGNAAEAFIRICIELKRKRGM